MWVILNQTQYCRMKTSDSSTRCGSRHESREAKFRKSLRSFLGFNFVIFILMLFGIGGATLWKISVIWGAILAFKGYGLYGKADDDVAPPPSRKQYGRPQRPQWRDKDLV